MTAGRMVSGPGISATIEAGYVAGRRPREGHRERWRFQRLPCRGRGRAARARRHPAGGGHRRARRTPRRDASGLHRSSAEFRPDGRGRARVRARACRRVQASLLDRFVGELPLLPSGKVDRRALATVDDEPDELAIETHGRRRARTQPALRRSRRQATWRSSPGSCSRGASAPATSSARPGSRATACS